MLAGNSSENQAPWAPASMSWRIGSPMMYTRMTRNGTPVLTMRNIGKPNRMMPAEPTMYSLRRPIAVREPAPEDGGDDAQCRGEDETGQAGLAVDELVG